MSPQPDLLFWSDVSDQGWGANLLDRFVSGRWSPEEKLLSINLRELQAIRLGLQHFRFSLVGQPVAMFSDNTMALSYVHKQGGTFSPALSEEAHHHLRWAEDWSISIIPQSIMGSRNMVTDSLSRRSQVIRSEWTLVQEVVDKLIEKWPATIDLFATSVSYHLSVYFYSPQQSDVSRVGCVPSVVGRDASVRLPSICSHSRGFEQAAPVQRDSSNIDRFSVATENLLELAVAPPVVLPSRPDLLKQSHVHRFHQHLHMIQLQAWG